MYRLRKFDRLNLACTKNCSETISFVCALFPCMTRFNQARDSEWIPDATMKSLRAVAEWVSEGCAGAHGKLTAGMTLSYASVKLRRTLWISFVDWKNDCMVSRLRL